VGVVCGLLIASAFVLTFAAIARNEAEALQQAVFKVLPGAVAKASFVLAADDHFRPAQAGDAPQQMVNAGYDADGALVGVAIEAQAVGYPMDGNGIPFNYKGDADEASRGGVNNVFIDFGTPAYSPNGFNVNFKYDRASNSYLRYQGGKAHIDRETGGIISVKNVVVLITDIEGPIDQYKHMAVRTTGSGQAFYFIDGNAVDRGNHL